MNIESIAMKVISTILSIILLAVFTGSSSLPRRIERFVNNVEENHMNWSEEEWNKSEIKYKELTREYKENISSFSHEERLSINQNLGKYNGLRVKHYAEDAGKAIQEFSERFPYWLEGFLSAFE